MLLRIRVFVRTPDAGLSLVAERNEGGDVIDRSSCQGDQKRNFSQITVHSVPSEPGAINPMAAKTSIAPKLKTLIHSL